MNDLIKCPINKMISLGWIESREEWDTLSVYRMIVLIQDLCVHEYMVSPLVTELHDNEWHDGDI